MAKPSVSVIVPNYNYAKFLSARLDSILAQTYPISELIILDDASTDDSVTVIERKISKIRQTHPKLTIKFLKNTKNSGNVFSQWQKGIAVASGDYLWIAEVDDSCSPDFLQTALSPVAKHPNIVLSYTNSKLTGDVAPKDRLRRIYDLFRRRRLPVSYVASGASEVNRNLAIFNSIPNVSAVVFKNLPALTDILALAKNYRLSGDWFFYLNLLKFGQVAYSSKPCNFHRLSSASVTGRTSWRTRYAELKEIHSFARSSYQLSPSTLRRMARLERSLSSLTKS